MCSKYKIPWWAQYIQPKAYFHMKKLEDLTQTHSSVNGYLISVSRCTSTCMDMGEAFKIR